MSKILNIGQMNLLNTSKTSVNANCPLQALFIALECQTPANAKTWPSPAGLRFQHWTHAWSSLSLLLSTLSVSCSFNGDLHLCYSCSFNGDFLLLINCHCRLLLHCYCHILHQTLCMMLKLLCEL